MSIYICPPTPQTVEGFADKIDTVWKAVLCESPREDRAAPNVQVSTNTRVFPELSLDANYGRPWLVLGHERGFVPHYDSATITGTSRPRGRASKPSHQRKGRAKKSYSEPPPAIGSAAGDREHRPGGVQSGVRDGNRNTTRQGKHKSQDCDEGTPDGDMSESSLSADDCGYRKRTTECGRSQKVSCLPGATFESSSQQGSLGVAGGITKARPMVTTSTVRTLSASKSEGYISIARNNSGIRLPTVKSRPTLLSNTPKRRGRLRELRLPPPGGYQNGASNGLMKEIETQIAGLRASPRARRALEARVWHHLSKRSKRYSHRGRGRQRSLDDATSACSNDSAGSIGSLGSVEAGGVEGQPDDGGSWRERSTSTNVQRGDVGSAQGVGWSTSRKAVGQASVSERVAAQTLHAQEVLRRRRAIEGKRSKQVRERSAILKEEARRPRDKRAEKKRAEMLMTIVACAIGFAEWKCRFEDKKAAMLQAEREELGARSLQRVWRMNRVRCTLALVRASKPAVRSIVFSMRLKAAVAKEVVARRHRTQAADLIHAALRAGTRTLFRTRISYYIERIIKCQQLFTSYREVTKARKRALTNKWTRHVHKLDERRFSMYSAHLRDMYNFDPAAVELFMKEMRLLSAQGQTAAQAMKSKMIPLPGIVVATNAHASGDDHEGNGHANQAENAGLPSKEGAAADAGDANGKREGAACSPAGSDQPRGGPQRQKRGTGEADPGATRNSTIASVSGSAPKRAKVKLAAGWQKRVAHVHSDVEAQASLMCRRGVKHKEISRPLRNVLINDLLNCARREHRNWCWNHVRAAREKERQNAVVNMADIRSVLRTDSRTSDEGDELLEAKIRAKTERDKGYLPYNRLEYMQLMNMITDDVLMRFIVLAERIEGCVAADGSGRGSLSPEEIREIFVVNRHPNQHENTAAKEAKAELQAWAKGRGLTLPVMRRGSTSKAASYHLHQKALKEQQSEKARQVPYFDFMSAVKGGILLDICVPEGQRLALAGQPHPMSVPEISHLRA